MNNQSTSNNKAAKKLLWTAPELMTSSKPGTAMGDVYSFGVIIQEVTLQDEPFAEKKLDAEEIVQRIREGDKSMKPEIPEGNCRIALKKNQINKSNITIDLNFE